LIAIYKIVLAISKQRNTGWVKSLNIAKKSLINVLRNLYPLIWVIGKEKYAHPADMWRQKKQEKIGYPKKKKGQTA
jgi:hypothetical protein